MYEWTRWQDHVTQYENRYRESNNSDGTISHIPVEGEIQMQGTPQNAENFNHMEDGISDGIEFAAVGFMWSNWQNQQIEDMKGEQYTVELTNNQEYPFNNSVKTIALNTLRNHLNYTVEVEVQSYSGGFVGDVIVSDKLTNGFKVAYTGSAKSVKTKIFVKGGFY